MKKAILLFISVYFSFSAQAQNEKQLQLDTIEVVGITALHGIDISRNKVASKIQRATSQDFARLQSTDCTDFLNQRFSAVHLNDPNGNMLQPDVQYRGFVASPLLGMSQGIAVYQDGVRMNELFGDIVNWEIIPRGAIANVELSSGSNPLYGLNSFGGALSFQTKTGFSHQGQTVSINGGSFGRLSADYSGGWNMEHPESIGKGKSAFFINANHFGEQGWRDYSPSVSDQIFSKYSYLTDKNAWNVALSVSKSNLRGNGPLPIELLQTERNAVFTHPDKIQNTIGLLNIQHLKQLSNTVKLNSNVYYKYKKTETFNGDVSTYDDFNGFIVEEIEDSTNIEYIIDQNGNRIKATDETESAINNRTKTLQNSIGGTFQLAYTKPFLSKENHLVVGMSVDAGQANFYSTTELGQLTEDRGTIGSNLYDTEAEVFVKTNAVNSSIYATNALSVTDKLTLNVSVNAAHSVIQLKDQLGDELNGTHNFLRLNPSVGVVYELPKQVHFYANYAQSMRNPTPVELTCADKDAPCRLPNAFLSDPPLKQAQARTAEMGVWGGKKIRFEASIFRTDVHDDIYFISSGPSRNTGYFTNIGNTRRAGIELSASKTKGAWRWQTSYSLTNATFQTDFVVNSPNHPKADDGELEVEEGNYLPLIPKHIAKAGLDYTFKDKWIVGFDAIFNSTQYLRGDEANVLTPLKAFAVCNFRTQYKFNNWLTFFGRIQNVLNSRNETFGLLGNPREVEAFQNLTKPQFLTPNAPFSFNIGVVVGKFISR